MFSRNALRIQTVTQIFCIKNVTGLKAALQVYVALQEKVKSYEILK